MIGFPKDLRTKQDILNAVEYVKATGEGKEMMCAWLKRIKATDTRMELKESGRNKRADKQHQEDYTPVPDPNSQMRRLGFTLEEMDCLIGGIDHV